MKKEYVSGRFLARICEIFLGLGFTERHYLTLLAICLFVRSCILLGVHKLGSDAIRTQRSKLSHSCLFVESSADRVLASNSLETIFSI